MTNYCTLEDVKAMYNIEHTSDDALIEGVIIPQVSQYIDTQCNQPISSASYTEIRNGMGGGVYSGRVMTLCNTPATAVTSVTINGVVIPQSNGITPGWILMSTKDRIQLIDYTFTEGMSNVQLVYTAGYATIPADIQSVCLYIVGLQYQTRRRLGVSSENDGRGQTRAYKDDYPKWVEKILNNYTNIVEYS